MRFIIVLLFVVLATACKKDKVSPQQITNKPDTTLTDSNTITSINHPGALPKGIGDTIAIPTIQDSFITYFIKAGNNYCDDNGYPGTNISKLRFRAILDSSCIYTTIDPSNQEDINKLYGIGDCNSHHQTNSARVGWNWVRDSMRIHAYCYANTVRSYKELGVVAINQAFECSITVLPTKYVFELNGKTDTMARGCSDVTAKGYKLFPYFGGNEPAPHKVKIKIREL